MGKIIDLTGQKFGKLTVLEKTKERRNRQVVWRCSCECGKETLVVGSSLRSGHTKSCGCGNYDSKNFQDLTNQIFGKLIVIEQSGKDNYRHILWKCKCECGNIRIALGTELRQGKITACQECTKKTMDRNSGDNYIYENTKYYNDIINHKFGLLTPLEPTQKRDINGRVIWKCKCDCGNIIYLPTIAFKSGNTSSCGCLNQSKGEVKIKELLENNNIDFKAQYSNPKLLSPKNSKLKIDFAILHNDIPYLFIEFDGRQHYESVEYWGGEDYLKYLQQCDKIKNNYAKQNNIKMIRIPYYELDNITINELLGDKYAI